MGLTNFRPTKVQRIGAVLAIASAFLILELVLGFTTHSLALVADVFHIMSDIIGYAVAMLATKYAASQRTPPAQYTFGYQRAETVGAFFNGGAYHYKVRCRMSSEETLRMLTVQLF